MRRCPIILAYPDRYRHHIRMGQLHGRAAEVNEEAYEMLDSI